MVLDSKKFVSLKVDQVSKAYDKKMVLQEVSLEIHSGMILGLLGPNGAGKTTLMKIICGLATPTAGSVTLDGKKLDEIRKEAHLRIGVIPQNNNLERDLTVRDALRCYSWLFGVENYDRKIDKLARQFDFADMLEKLGSKLSGGYAQRVLIARALLPDPDILLLDEPSVGLDPDVRHHLWDMIRLLKEQGKAILLTTHYMEEAEELCDEVCFLQHGKVTWRGNPADLLAQSTGLEELFLDLVRKEEKNELVGRI